MGHLTLECAAVIVWSKGAIQVKNDSRVPHERVEIVKRVKDGAAGRAKDSGVSLARIRPRF
jgi:hypothetical protein